MIPNTIKRLRDDLSLKTYLTPFGRWMLGVVFVVFLIVGLVEELALLHGFWRRFFDPSKELGFGAILGSVQFFVIAGLSFIIGQHVSGNQRAFWRFLAGVFVFLALDEYFGIHEAVVVWLGGEAQLVLYAALGIALLVVVVRTVRREEGLPLELVFFLLVGMGTIATGALILDALASVFPCRLNAFWRLFCRSMLVAEEVFEMLGGTLILAAMLAHAQTVLSQRDWRRTRSVLVGGGALVALLYLGTQWLLPGLEARLLATPVRAEYAGGNLALVGYRVSRPVFHPGDRVTIRLYWRAKTTPRNVYFLSGHLVSHPEVASLTQTDGKLGGSRDWGAEGWPPGLVMRDVLRYDLPDEAAAPASYWLVVRLFEWYGEAGQIVIEETKDVPFSQTDLPALDEDEVVVLSVPVVPEGDSPPPADAAAYRFDDGFSLAGYSLPVSAVSGETLPLAFWWETDADVARDLTQYVHLFQTDGEGFVGFDQQPFGGSFPTGDWPAGIAVVDEVGMDLPPDLPPGEYAAFTGIYDLESGARSPVRDGEGQPVLDNSVPLGTLRVEPAGG